jgi:3-deoxy-D-manno-octulosonate 8-phosphate phosphatase (KDO 8-P phosphatase)
LIPVTATDRARSIRMLLMDVDGTLTDGSLLVTADGEEIKAYNVRDGLGILLARMAGLEMGLITGKTSKGLGRRAERLKIVEVHQGVLDKAGVLEDIMARKGLSADQIAYIGDDLGDLQIIRNVGLAAAVADAHPEIKKHCQFICGMGGGKGAVRELIEFILEAQGKWADLKERAHEIRNIDI